MTFGTWLREARTQAGLSQRDVVEYQQDGRALLQKSKTWLTRVEQGDPGVRLPDKATCDALGVALGLADPGEVWRKIRRDRLAQLDPNLLRWHDEEVRLARVMANPDSMPGEIRLLSSLLLPLSEEDRTLVVGIVKNLMMFARHAPGVKAEEGESPKERHERIGRMSAADRWKPITDLLATLEELTAGLPPHAAIELVSGIAKAQLEARRLLLRQKRTLLRHLAYEGDQEADELHDHLLSASAPLEQP